MKRPSQTDAKPEAASAPARCRLGASHTDFSISEHDFRLTENGGPAFAVIGQDRAMLAMRLALSIRAKGYNLFVSGPAGTGKRTAINHALSQLPFDAGRLRDIALVHDFKDGECPRPLYFPAGGARKFRSALREFLLRVHGLAADLGRQGQFRAIRDSLVMNTESRGQDLIAEFEKRLAGEGFKIVQVEEDDSQKTDVYPLLDGELSDFEALHQLVAKGEMAEADYNALRQRQLQLVDEMKEIFETLRLQRQEMAGTLNRRRQELLDPAIDEGLRALAAEFPDPATGEFLAELGRHMRSQASFAGSFGFDPADPAKLSEAKPAEASDGAPAPRGRSDLPEALRIYDLNVLVDNGDAKANPLIVEQYPDYQKLFGVVESAPEGQPEPAPAHLLVRAGSLLKASGGFIVLRAEDLLRDEDLYVAVKRAMQDMSVEIRGQAGPLGQAASSLKPQPIAIDLKMVVMGGDGIYEALFERDEDFQKLFKVPAEFDSVVDRTPAICQAYADFFMLIQREDSLLPLTPSAVAAMLEYAVRVSEFRNKLSTRFSLLADIVRESHYWAAQEGAAEIRRGHVAKTLGVRTFLYNLPEEQIDEQILQGEILMLVDGSAVGRINGLAVMDRGYYSFGRPTVISANAAPGSEGVVNVERESGLSGEIHDKGTFIVASYIQSTYARDFPLSVHASICFEQSYTEIDGDSASSAELYALLSSIAGLPLRQDVAVTGSVSQMGQIQPVGGVVEKVEGFFAVCKKVGLTGSQGVIVPWQNVINLILSPELQEALRDGRFHVWAIRSIDEGLEILTGLPAGARTAKGGYPAGTVNFLVEKRLRDMARATKEFGN